MWNADSSEALEESLKERLKTWLSLAEEQNFNFASVREHLKCAVPFVYAPRPDSTPADFVETEDVGLRLILDPLHEFITGSKDYEPIYTSLKANDKAPSLCGKIFNIGEPTYGCRDCGFDATCVLCPDCFKASPHIKHRYSMSTSTGGGYCDCGDHEAWKNDVHCTAHDPANNESSTPAAALADTHPGLVYRLTSLLEGLVTYMFEVHTIMEGMAMSTDLELTDLEPTRQPILDKLRHNFSTVLINDENHTYEQVIQLLERTIRCNKKDAVSLVTFIDRNGSCVVTSGPLESCQEVKSAIDKIGNNGHGKYKLRILRSYVYGHQMFACQLLVWLDKLISKCDSFKNVFAQVMFTQNPNSNLMNVEQIMYCDHLLYKNARVNWSKLLVSSLLMDLEYKNRFAKLFVKHYGAMMRQYIVDDHDHSVSIVSMAVQLFTMPTIAHMLIATEDVLARLFITLLTEMSSMVKEGKLTIGPLGRESNSDRAHQFRRTQFILFDLKYILTMVPVTWTDELRRGFLHGFHQFIDMGKHLHNMDTMTRKTGAHVEYEQDWEGSFNLQIKLAPLLPMFLEWALSDRVVFIKCVRMLLKALNEESTFDTSNKWMREVAGVTVLCIDYDVSQKPVSLHIVLSRLAAAFISNLSAYNLTYDSPELSNIEKPSMMVLIEPSMRAVTVTSQVKVGLWKRNGMSVVSQIYYYRNLRCRSEMFDRDLLMLQIALVNMPPDNFLITLLNKFELVSWLRPDFVNNHMWNTERELEKQMRDMLEEMLLILLHVVSERCSAGVGQVTPLEALRHEIVHLLSVTNMPHSMVHGSLGDVSGVKDQSVEEVLQDVADFKKAGEDTRGVYELKEKYYDNFNMYYYHYTKEDQTKAEVMHRERCRKRRKPEVVVPVQPPPFTPAFQGCIQLLNCKVFRSLMTLVCQRFGGKCTSVTEGCVRLVCHLLGVGWWEEQRAPATVTAPGEVLAALGLALDRPGLDGQLQDLLNWTKEKYSSLVEPDTDSNAATIASSEAEAAAAEEEEASLAEERVRKRKMAEVRRQAILAGMAAKQKDFIKNHELLFTEEKNDQSEESRVLESKEDEVMQVTGDDAGPVCVGEHQSAIQNSVFTQSNQCIVCHTSDRLVEGPRLLVVGVMIQSSTVLALNRHSFKSDKQGLYLDSDLNKGTHVSSCNHAMHVECWKNYHKKLVAREARRTMRYRQIFPFDLDNGEFPCPMCERVCNAGMPLLPPPTVALTGGTVLERPLLLPPDRWLSRLYTAVDTKKLRPPPLTEEPLENAYSADVSEPVKEATSVVGVWLPPTLVEGDAEVDKFVHAFSSPYATATPASVPEARESNWELLHSLFKYGYREGENEKDERILGASLTALAYTIRTFEVCQRNSGRALFAQVTDREESFLSYLTASIVRAAEAVPEHHGEDVVQCAAIGVISDVLGGSSVSILEVDMFSAVVSLLVVGGRLYGGSEGLAKGGAQDHMFFKTCLLGHIVQLLLTYEGEGEMETDECEDDSGADATWLRSLFTRCCDALGKTVYCSNGALHAYVKRSCLPFLRCCGALFRALTGVAAPEELRTEVWVAESEYLCLLRYLGCAAGLGAGLDGLGAVLDRWLSHARILKCYKSQVFNGAWCASIPKLKPLPPDYSDLIDSASAFTCPTSSLGDRNSNSSLCLVCGHVMCMNLYCCQSELTPGKPYLVGPTTMHTQVCGAGTGLFLRVSECRMMLRAGTTRGVMNQAPYVDKYGETDGLLRRGNPLFLSQEQMTRLNLMWLTHQIPEAMSKLLTTTTNQVGQEWDHI